MICLPVEKPEERVVRLRVEGRVQELDVLGSVHVDHSAVCRSLELHFQTLNKNNHLCDDETVLKALA